MSARKEGAGENQLVVRELLEGSGRERAAPRAGKAIRDRRLEGTALGDVTSDHLLE